MDLFNWKTLNEEQQRQQFTLLKPLLLYGAWFFPSKRAISLNPILDTWFVCLGIHRKACKPGFRNMFEQKLL